MATPSSAPTTPDDPRATCLLLLRAARLQIELAADCLADPLLDTLRLAVEARSMLAAAAVKVNLAIQRESMPRR